jgi:NarL family two-component system response regulator YdfI
MRFALVARSLAIRLSLEAMLEAEPEVCLAFVGSSAEDFEYELGEIDCLVIDFEEELWSSTADAIAGRNLGLVLLGADVSAVTNQFAAKGMALLSRNASGPEIVAAARAASQGLIVFDTETAPLTHTAYQSLEPLVLTQRELAVLQSMSDGLANKQIAQKLGISIHTVKFHVAAVLSKLGASSRTEAVTLGMRSGLIRL